MLVVIVITTLLLDATSLFLIRIVDNYNVINYVSM